MMLKRLSSLLILVLLVFGYSVTGFAKERVSVLAFDGKVDEQYKQAAVNNLNKILLNFGKYDVVERAEVEKIIQEQNFQMTDLVDPTTAVQVGKILGVSIAFIGNIDQLTYSWNKTSYQAVAKITIKVIDVQTAKILNIIEGRGTSSGVDRSATLHEALDACFTDQILKDFRVKIAPFSSIIKVEGENLYFLNGKDVGLKKGMRFQVLRPEANDFGDDAATDESVETEFATADDSFKRAIGLVEVAEVIADKSRAIIIWNSEPIRRGDVLAEVENPNRGLISFGLRTTNSTVEDSSGVKTTDPYAKVYEGRFLSELPYSYSSGIIFNYTPLNKAIGDFNLGWEYTKEFPLIRGSLYLTGMGGLGFGWSSQTTNLTGYAATAGSLYATAGGGLKLYLGHEDGVRVEFGAVGQFGPVLNRWTENTTENDMTDWVDYPKADLSGFGLRLMVDIPL
ncbi:MAG TPA: CsgG/HfaB family protein [Bacillota bacterium]